MKKVIVAEAPKIFAEQMPMGILTIRDVGNSDKNYLNSELTDQELASIKDVVSELKENCNGRPNALWNLAVCYDCGIGVEQDEKAADIYYRLAYMQFLIDTNVIEVEKEEGMWRIVNLMNDAQVYKTAALKGYACAMYFYGLSYLNGAGVQENDEMANFWFKKSADKGFVEAISALANSYLRGYGVEKDINKAIELFQTAVDYGNPNAMCSLGSIYYNAGLEQEGIEYFMRAASLGYEPAKKILNEIRNR